MPPARGVNYTVLPFIPCFVNTLELIAALLGVISVWLLVRRNVLAFPIGIVMVILYAVVFYQTKFYADMGLQFIYVIMQAQGWYEWTRGDRDAEDKISIIRLNQRQWMLTAVLLLIGTLLIGYTMHRFTDAALPWVDAFTTSLSLLAQWWMNKKYLENWALWIAVDIIYLYQYTAKALYFTTALYAVFLVLAWMGWQEWRKKAAALPST